MDLKYLYELSNYTNILEKYDLPYNFFTKPHKVLSEDECLNQIINLLSNKNITFPINDTSDVIDLIDNKNIEFMTETYKLIKIKTKNVNVPYIKKTDNNFIKLICFIRAYASHTYNSHTYNSHTYNSNTYNNRSFKDYFIYVFNVFYNPL
jgi:hypothetical protein